MVGAAAVLGGVTRMTGELLLKFDIRHKSLRTLDKVKNCIFLLRTVVYYNNWNGTSIPVVIVFVDVHTENMFIQTVVFIVNYVIVCSVSGGDNVRADGRRALHRAADGGRHGLQVGGRRARPPGHLRRAHRAQRVPLPRQQRRVPAHLTGRRRHAAQVSAALYYKNLTYSGVICN